MGGHDDGAAREPGSMAGARRATVGGSSDAVGSSSRRTGRGHSRARASATRWRSPALSVSPSWPSAVSRAGRRGWPRARRGRRRRARACSSSSAASGAPSRRFSARVALKRWGRCGSQEKWRPPRRRALCAATGRPSTAMVPAVRLDEAQQGGQHGRLAAIPMARSAPAVPRAAHASEKPSSAGAVAVRVVDPQARRRSATRDRRVMPGSARHRPPPAGARDGRGAGSVSPAPRARGPPPPAPRCWRGTRHRRGAAG